MDQMHPIYFRPRVVPTYGVYAEDELRAGGEDLPIGQLEELVKTIPKFTKLENAKDGKILNTLYASFSTIYSSDPKAYVTANAIRINIGSGVFTIFSGSISFSTRFTLFHEGEVTIYHRSIERSQEYAFECINVNMIVKDRANKDIILVLSNGLLCKVDSPLEPRIEAAYGNAEDHVRTLKSVNIIFDEP